MNVQIPEIFKGLFEPHRYRVYYGGRGGGKSWAIAQSLIIRAANSPLRILCAREVQNSIKDSVHKLLSDTIDKLNMGHLFTVTQNSITSTCGSEFIFKGIKHCVQEIKSTEGCDVCWLEEAQTVSKKSWDILIPTIRKPGSEIIISFNAELDTDETYKRFVLQPPPQALVIKANWDANPFFPDELKSEMEHMKSVDYDGYLTTWEGHCRMTLDGAIYAKEIRDATSAGRITRVPHDPAKPVHTFWDLGWSDCTSIWFVQPTAFEFRVIDFYQNSQEPLNHYIQTLQQRGYIYGTDWLPHDARAKQLGSGRSVEELMVQAGRKVEITPNIGIADGINAARTIFPQCYFDEAKTSEGLNSLRRYRYDTTPEGQLKRAPLHDDASHAADAFRYLAVGLRPEKKQKPINQQLNPYRGMRNGWAG